MKSEAELAGVLAHKISHVLRKHHLQGLKVNDSSLALMFKTHPALVDRLDLLDKLMSGPFDRFETQPDLAPRFMAVLDNAAGGTGSKVRRK